MTALRRLSVGVLATLTVLASCGGETRTETSTTSTAATPTTSTSLPGEPSTAGQPGGDLANVLRRGSLRVGVVSGTALADFDLRIAERIAAEIDDTLFVQPVEVTAATRFDLLDAGQIDLVMGGVSRTTARDELFGRTSNYLMDGLAVLVPADSPIMNAADLEARTVAVTEGTSLGILLASTLDSQGIAAEVMFSPDPLAALADGDADAVTTSIVLGLSGRPGFRAVPVAADSGVAILTALGQDELTAAVDAVLRRMIADGTWTQIFEETFGFPPPWTLQEMASAGPID